MSEGRALWKPVWICHMLPGTPFFIADVTSWLNLCLVTDHTSLSWIKLWSWFQVSPKQWQACSLGRDLRIMVILECGKENPLPILLCPCWGKKSNILLGKIKPEEGVLKSWNMDWSQILINQCSSACIILWNFTWQILWELLAWP